MKAELATSQFRFFTSRSTLIGRSCRAVLYNRRKG